MCTAPMPKMASALGRDKKMPSCPKGKVRLCNGCFTSNNPFDFGAGLTYDSDPSISNRILPVRGGAIVLHPIFHGFPGLTPFPRTF